MALKITRPDGRTVTEPVGGALLDFVDGVARVTGYVSQLRPSLVAGLRRRGWTATNTRKTTSPGDQPRTVAPMTSEQAAAEVARVEAQHADDQDDQADDGATAEQ